MNRISRFLNVGYCLAAIASLVTCKPIPEYSPQPPPAYGSAFWGEVQGTRNNVALMNPRILASPGYASNTPLCNPGVFSVEIREFDKSGWERLGLSLSALPRRVGSSQVFQRGLLRDTCSNSLLPHASFFVSECDVALGDYLPVRGRPNVVKISTFDTQTREVTGSFDLYFAVNRCPMPTAPDSLHVIGTFKTKLLPEGKLRYE